MPEKRAIKLGDKVKDIVSGLSGIVTSKVEYLNGCIQFGIEPPMPDGGKLTLHYVDEGQLKKMKGGLNVEPKAEGTKRRGGPQGHRTPSGLNRSQQTDRNCYTEEP